jgi:Do/DeqQ family serine protease
MGNETKMSKTIWLRALGFVALSTTVGLAAAFVAVLIRPELVQRTMAPLASRVLPGDLPKEKPVAVPDDSQPVTAESPPSTASATSPKNADMPVRSYASAVERAAPAVVNVYTARVVTERIRPNPIDEMFGDAAPRFRQRVERSLGSGVIVDARGHIVTNHHVIATADAVRVQLADGRVADAKIVGRDPDTDLAVLKIDLPRLPVMPLGRSDRLRVGDVVLAIGNPVGLSQTVTQGIVSATGRGQLGVATFENFIQTDAPINVGNSGGALVNVDGELIGINTAVLAKNLGVEGIGFAIPVNLARGVMDEILARGRVVRGWIGVIPQDIADLEARQLGLARGGVVINNLYVGSPAADAGIRPGDLILGINGQAVTSAQDSTARIATLKPGATAEIRGLRGAQEFTVSVPVVERPRTTER